MTPLVLTLAGALACAGQVVEVAFLPDDAALPPLVVRVSQQGTSRSLAWVVAAPQPASGVRADQRGAPHSLLAVPQAPAGASLLDDGQVLVLGIDDAGDWARRYEGKNGRTRVAGVSVAGERALRLVVPALGAPAGPATLVGGGVRIAGRGAAMALAKNGAAPARAIVRAGAELVLAEPTAVDGTKACGAVVAASWSSERPALRLLADGSPVCVGSMAVARVAGVRVGPRVDQAVSGVVIASAP